MSKHFPKHIRQLLFALNGTVNKLLGQKEIAGTTVSAQREKDPWQPLGCFQVAGLHGDPMNTDT